MRKGESMKGLNRTSALGARTRIRSTLFAIALTAGSVLVATGCGPDDDDSTDEKCEPPAGERGTAECKRWHAALCDYASRCSDFSQCTCVDQASAITCTSDAEATECADRIESSSCSEPPLGCDLVDLADRTVAQAGCEQFITTLCAAQQRCTGDDPATCAVDVRAELDCSIAVGLKPSFEQCLSELQTFECTATEAPESCNEAMLFDF
jgi:hypothetical protein